MNSVNHQTERILIGTIVSGGMAEGRARLFIHTDFLEPTELDALDGQTEDGWSRIEDAINEQLEKLERRIHQGGFCEDSAVFSLLETYRALLLDPFLHASLQNDLQKMETVRRQRSGPPAGN